MMKQSIIIKFSLFILDVDILLRFEDNGHYKIQVWKRMNAMLQLADNHIR